MNISERKFFSRFLAKYVAEEVLGSFLIGTAVFVSIMLLFQAIRLMEFVVVHQVRLTDILNLCLCLGLSFLPISIPVAFLFSVLIGISRANSEGEIIALQVNGMSLGQVFAPLGVFSLFLSLLCVYLNFYTVPQGNRSFELLQSRLGNEKIISSLKPGVFNEGFFGLTMLAEHVIPLKSEMENIFVYDRRDETRPLVITARMGMLKNNLDKGILTLRLSEGAIHTESADDETIQQKINFDVYDINLDVGFSPEGWAHLSPPSYTYPQLMERIHQTVLDPPEHRIFLVELHRRVSMAFSCTVFAALGFFIGILSHRGMRGQVVVICLLVTLGYWLSYLFLNAYVLAGSLAPWFGIWLPNFMFLGVAYYCYRRYVGG